MKRFFALTVVTFFALVGFVCAGPQPISDKEMKQVAPPPCPEWYGDQEWNVAVWGAFAFGGDNNETLTTESTPSGNSFHLDRGIIEDTAFGGGADVKYFFHRYFGVGIEGFILDPNRGDLDPTLIRLGFRNNDDVVGALKGTFTLRFPLQCSRFAPYVWAGGGVMWGRDRQDLVRQPNESLIFHRDDDPQAVGEVGGGIEVRFTRHIGWINDISWDFTENDNFGMLRSGINFAF